jgi:hypothetical protein
MAANGRRRSPKRKAPGWRQRRRRAPARASGGLHRTADGLRKVGHFGDDSAQELFEIHQIDGVHDLAEDAFERREERIGVRGLANGVGDLGELALQRRDQRARIGVIEQATTRLNSCVACPGARWLELLEHGHGIEEGFVELRDERARRDLVEHGVEPVLQGLQRREDQIRIELVELRRNRRPHLGLEIDLPQTLRGERERAARDRGTSSDPTTSCTFSRIPVISSRASSAAAWKSMASTCAASPSSCASICSSTSTSCAARVPTVPITPRPASQVTDGRSRTMPRSSVSRVDGVLDALRVEAGNLARSSSVAAGGAGGVERKLVDARLDAREHADDLVAEPMQLDTADAVDREIAIVFDEGDRLADATGCDGHAESLLDIAKECLELGASSASIWRFSAQGFDGRSLQIEREVRHQRAAARSGEIRVTTAAASN